ncbi:MAG: endopeptidase La, partial [Sutterella sp.]|nr:endopeptidase La [Sutterella sp.]
EDENGEASEFDQLERRILDAKLPEKVESMLRQELKRLKQMPPMSSEATVVRSYLDTMLDIPWSKKSRISKDLKKAAAILDEDHSGLEKVKERILEYLAVQKRVGKMKAPILCLVGAPGVGKTSLGESIARATGRQYVRVALGGVHDESEIRGHRRTYVGSMPGQIIKGMIRAGVKNPLFLLDEIDKMGMDYRGDPASALLEVLDPEQNSTFQDHYVEATYDLSEVMFVATSNSYNIPGPLLDRMEVISLSGYTEEEKLHIARKHLLPKQLRATGLNESEVNLTDEAILGIIRYYTREAGVRGLERSIGKILRKLVLKSDKTPASKSFKATKAKAKAFVVTRENLHEFLGPEKFTIEFAKKEPRVGVVNGLAWTEVGGDLLQIEAQVFPGKGAIQRTGSLGDVMKESVEAARSVVRSRATEWGLENDRFYATDLHVHFPDGATPKDGPSAGAATTTAIISAMTGIAVKSDIAMTGEINLHGEVLQIGGLKEKLLAAVRAGCTTVLIPETNVRDLEELPQSAKDALRIVPVKTIDDVIKEALVKQPEPLKPAKKTRAKKEEVMVPPKKTTRTKSSVEAVS